MKKVTNVFLAVLLYGAVIPFTCSLPALLAAFLGAPLWVPVVMVPVFAAVWYLLLRKKIDLRLAFYVNAGILAFLILTGTVMMSLASGNISGRLMNAFPAFFLPFAPMILVYRLGAQPLFLYLTVFLTYLMAILITGFSGGKRKLPRVLWIAAAVLILCLIWDVRLYQNRPEKRYGGHGFAYMHGYSSTDFTDYMVYSKNSKLVVPDTPPDLQIDDVSEMPVMDGAEACYPVYAAAAKAVYKDIDQIELAYKEKEDEHLMRLNGQVVTFTNTVQGFMRLVYGDKYYEEKTDLFFGARPSRTQMQDAKDEGVELTITPIGQEAFVFFVEEDNPVDNITSDDLRSIYHGDITNWEQLGGKAGKITAFQRPEGSGSQSMMQYFMGDVSLMEPKSYEYVDSMAGVIKKTAEYANENGAIGYSFRYFIEGLSQETGVKLLSVDGVAPTLENIENGSYPLTVDLCLITRKDDKNPNVQKMIDFMLSECGQEIVRKTGYGGVK